MFNARTFKPLKKPKEVGGGGGGGGGGRSEGGGGGRGDVGRGGGRGEDIVEIDIKELGGILRGLWRIRNKAIRELTEEENRQFRKIVDIVNDVYDTQQCSIFLDVIKRYFDEREDIQPGTIGAYFSGCLINNSNCAPICETIFPDKCERNFCQDNIVWSHNMNGVDVLGNNNNNLLVLNRVKTSDRAFLFINVTNLNNYMGLTSEEKQQLLVLGIKEVKIIGYLNDGKSYLELTNWVPVNQVKSRISITPSFMSSIDDTNTDKSENSDNNNVTRMLLVISIILILLFFIWRLSIHYS